LKTEPWIPNQDERRVSKILWSMVSKTAERLRRLRYIAPKSTDKSRAHYFPEPAWSAWG